MKKINKKSVWLSDVEKSFISETSFNNQTTSLPYIVVDDFPKLGLLTSLRFIEWIAENPEGVISLPTGKTPEYFIKWTEYILENWNSNKVVELRAKHGLQVKSKPTLSGLHFIQIDEFYPIHSSQHNSFYNYVVNYYINDFGLDLKKALLINCDQIPMPENRHFIEVFPEYNVDLSLRYRPYQTASERLQQEAIYMIDDWCCQYEEKIREKGGIGFFLGGIGPDGHIAFNIRGSSRFSSTRLTSTNFETQAVAASDLGGIEISANRQVITIGLETITYNPEAVAIIIAAGESKAGIVKNSLEHDITNIYPATILSKLKNSRFYLTEGSAVEISDKINQYYTTGEWQQAKTEKSVLSLCQKLNKYGHRLLVDDLKKDPFCKLIPNLSDETVNTVTKSILDKINNGLRKEENQIFLHTGPHHDDIMLGILPFITNHMNNPTNDFYFSVLTSGFNAVTNKFVIESLKETKVFLDHGMIQMVDFPDFFESGYKYKGDKDIYHYLTNLTARNKFQQKRGVSHRIVRVLTEIYKPQNTDELRDCINEMLSILNHSYDGEKNPPKIQKLKGALREFEEELVWAHFGIPIKNIIHNRLGFYKGDIFTEEPEKKRDVQPIVEMFKRINPTVISLAFDPEGSGPDTHYKVLQAIAEGLREWKKEKKDLSKIRIWGYRNVWFKFNPADANVIVPVSLDQMSSMDAIFKHCYLSQVDASFPSYEMNDCFSSLAQKIWVEQLESIQLLLGKDYFYLNNNPELRSSHGLIFLKEMTVSEFLLNARELEKSVEGSIKV
jgi:glucosamine-6-phosphate deaminase